MLDPSSSRPSFVLILLVAAFAACRVVPEPTGTPLGPNESLAVGVVREHDGWGLRQADLIASSEQIASDIARLTKIGDGGRSAILLLDDPANATVLPAGSFAPIRFQLVSGIARACEARGFRVVRPSDPEAARAEFTMLSTIRGFARDDGVFVLAYVVAEGSRRAEAGGALIGTVRTTVR